LEHQTPDQTKLDDNNLNKLNEYESLLNEKEDNIAQLRQKVILIEECLKPIGTGC
jgi:hypothetical protein